MHLECIIIFVINIVSNFAFLVLIINVGCGLLFFINFVIVINVEVTSLYAKPFIVEM